MKRVAIYPGSFDPATNGHVDVIRRGAALFDEVIVAVGHNPDKRRYWFDLEERRAMIVEACSGVANMRVIAFSGLMVNAAKEQGANVILRGLRALSDFELEFRNSLANRDLSGIETLFLVTAPENVFVASSLVKEIALNGGDVSRYVPEPVARAIRARLARP